MWGSPWPPLENLVSPTYPHRRGGWQSYPAFIWCPESKGHMVPIYFFPALACKWRRSISDGLSHEISWTLAGVRPRCPGLFSAAVIQYVIFIWRWPREFEKGRADEGRGGQEAGKGWGWWAQWDENRKGKNKRGSRDVCKIGRKISSVFKLVGVVGRKELRLAGEERKEILRWCLAMVLYSKHSKDFILQ